MKIPDVFLQIQHPQLNDFYIIIKYKNYIYVNV